MRHIWQLVFPDRTEYWESLESVKGAVSVEYGNWIVRPAISIEREDYISWLSADGKLIEAYRVELKS